MCFALIGFGPKHLGGGAGEESGKTGSFFPRQERNYSNDGKGCNELIPSPAISFQLHILALGCGPPRPCPFSGGSCLC